MLSYVNYELSSLRRIVEAEPSNGHAAIALCLRLLQKGEFDEALALAETATERVQASTNPHTEQIAEYGALLVFVKAQAQAMGAISRSISLLSDPVLASSQAFPIIQRYCEDLRKMLRDSAECETLSDIPNVQESNGAS